MSKNIIISRVIIYAIYASNVLVNSALVFMYSYNPQNRNISLALFSAAVTLLLLVPTYLAGKRDWFRKK